MDYALRPYTEADKALVSGLIAFSSDTASGEVTGYPRCDSFQELQNELDLYDCCTEDALFIITDENEPIGFAGMLYSRDDESIILFGPYSDPKHYAYHLVVFAITQLYETVKDKNCKVSVFISSKNNHINRYVAESKFRHLSTHIELCFYFEDYLPRAVNNAFPISRLANREAIEKEKYAIISLSKDVFNWDNPSSVIQGLIDSGCLFYCIKMNGEYAAFAAVDTMQDVDFARLEYLGVSPAHRKRGMATALIESIFRNLYMERKEIKKLYLSHSDINDNANSLYLKLGFKHELEMYEYEVAY